MQRLAGVVLFACFLALVPSVINNGAYAQVQALTMENSKLNGLENAKVGEIDLRNKWGIEITALRLTAADRMIDFRYKVLDAEKATPLFKRENKPYLIDEATGKVLSVPAPAKVGPLRNSNPPKEGRIYWMFFGNGGNLVKKGDKVTIKIGDFRADKLIVE